MTTLIVELVYAATSRAKSRAANFPKGGVISRKGRREISIGGVGLLM